MILISTKQGKLFQDGESIKSELFQPSKKFEIGDLSIEASSTNIHQVSESLLALFIRPQGKTLKNDRKWDYLKMDVVKKYTDGTYPPRRSDTNLTRGWCYLVAGVLHRFFYRKYDLYKVKCPLTPKGVKDDFHWWLESKCGKYVIDLTEEQYLKVGIENVRDGGKKHGAMGNSYGKKTRNIAFLVATHRYPDAIDFSKLQTTGYTKKYSEISDALTANEVLDGFDEKRHARIKSIKFHTGQHLTNGRFHLEREINKYWEGRYIEFDPNESLENSIRLLERESDKLFKVSNYFVLEKVVLTSSQTKVKRLQEEYKRTIIYNHDLKEEKEFNQIIRVINAEHSLLTEEFKDIQSLVIDLDEFRREMEEIHAKYLNTYDHLHEKRREIFKRNQLSGPNVRSFRDSFPKDFEGKSTFANWKF